MEKVMIVEIKSDYALAMSQDGEVVRIQKKEGMNVGDQIYMTPEDRQKRPASGKTLWLRRAAAAVAALALVCMLALPKMTPKAYAMVSFDGRQSVQLQVDEHHRVLKAVSPNGSVAADELKSLRGKDVMELDAQLKELLGAERLLVAYAPYGDSLDEGFTRKLESVYGEKSFALLPAKAEDLTAAEQQAISLGEYLMSLKLTETEMDQLEKLCGMDVEDIREDMQAGKVPELEDLGLQGLQAMAGKFPEVQKDPAFQAALEEALEDQRDDIDDDDDDLDDADDDDDDLDDVDDDDDDLDDIDDDDDDLDDVDDDDDDLDDVDDDDDDLDDVDDDDDDLDDAD